MPDTVSEAAPSDSLSESKALRWDAIIATWHGDLYEARKWLIDYTFTLILLSLLAIPMATIAALIRLDSPGQVFFRQPRIGHRNEVFMIWKFRTMRNDLADPDGKMLTLRNDPRITRVGAFLRRTSIDELPQLFNVLSGDMSLVGPRPHPTHAKAGDRLYRDVVPDYAARHVVKPGITGWAQVNGWRGETAVAHQIEQRVAYDMAYIARRSIRFDLWIMLLTVLREIRSKSAF